ncbi:MAG: haloacid dehalogenase [Nocardiopsaceae bacterium]|jgi:beta-phosphoglucomutase-like phosphatase (HAD superfamily)|nr:haloacid dehalogenase [Nocardiopsaceae bacterium]
MSRPIAASLVCCELIGTLAADDGLMERAYAEACATQGIVPGTAAYTRSMVRVHQARGQPPVEAFRALFPDAPGQAEAAAPAAERTLRPWRERAGGVPASGAEEAIGCIRDAGIRLCVVSCLSRRLLGQMLDALGWWRLVDLALCPEDVHRGAPWPDLMLAAMLRLGVKDVREAAVAAATESMARRGRRAGAGPLLTDPPDTRYQITAPPGPPPPERDTAGRWTSQHSASSWA